MFGEILARRDVLSDALGVDDADDPAEVVVEAVAAVRDALGLPSRLRDGDGPASDAFPDVAEYVLADSIAANTPADLEPTVEDVEAVPRAAY